MQASHHHHSSDQSTAYPTSSAVPQPTYGNTMRRASFDDGVVDPQKVEGSSRQLVTGSKISNQEDDKLYQNIHPSTPQRSSPTKKSHFSPVSVPVPEGYYNLTPPPLVRRHNSSPSSSPEEGSLHLAAAMSHGQELSIVGDSLIMNRSAHSKTPSNGDIGGTYQNVEFMRTDNQGMTKRCVSLIGSCTRTADILPCQWYLLSSPSLVHRPSIAKCCFAFKRDMYSNANLNRT